MSSSTVTYTSISSDSDLPLWGFHLMDPVEFEAPEEVPQSPEQAPPSPDYEEESSKDDDDEEEEEAFEEDEDEEEEHLAPADSATLPTIDPVPSAEDTKAFETDEAHISVRPHTPSSPSTEALIAEYASAPTPPSPLSPLSSPLLRIPSPPPLLPPLHTSPTYASAPLGYRASMIQSDIPEADMSSQNRLCFTAPASRAMTIVDEVDERVTNLAITQRLDAQELRMRFCQDGVAEVDRRGRFTNAFRRINQLEAREAARAPERQDGPADTGSSC
ncbi:hypothetical protein Tco_1422098 [Tanacetum coccineum]